MGNGILLLGVSFLLLILLDWQIQESDNATANQDRKEYDPIYSGPVAAFVFRLASWCWSILDHHHEPILAGFTILLAVFTLALWLATWQLANDAKESGDRQAEATREALDIAKEAADAAKTNASAALVSLRPWVSCDAEILGDFTYRENGDAQIAIRFVLKNYGHTPAMGVRVQHWFNLIGPGMEHPILQRKKWVDFDRGLPISAWEHGVLLFPGEERRHDIGLMIHRQTIEASIADIKPARHFLPSLAGLVSYSYALADLPAHTGFIFDLQKKVPSGDSGTALVLDEPTRADELNLYESPSWTYYAS